MNYKQPEDRKVLCRVFMEPETLARAHTRRAMKKKSLSAQIAVDLGMYYALLSIAEQVNVPEHVRPELQAIVNSRTWTPGDVGCIKAILLAKAGPSLASWVGSLSETVLLSVIDRMEIVHE